MKITRILAYRIELPLHEGSYKWSCGKSVLVFDSTVVAVETDAGITGYGEICPLGPFYLPARLVVWVNNNNLGGHSIIHNFTFVRGSTAG